MKPDTSKMCFGLSETLDQESMAIFLALCGRKEFRETFAQRLSSEEIIEFTDHFMKLLRRHLNETEYHSLFLGDSKHHNDKKQ